MGIKVKWLGHASFLIKAGEKMIYIDPYEGEYENKADIILVSHSHGDHCSVPIINRIREEDTIIIATPGCVPLIGGDVKTIESGESITLEKVTVEAVPAYNLKRFRSPNVPFHPKGLGVGFLITIQDKIIYHAGDTGFIPEMSSLKKVDLALLPCGGTYTMDINEAVDAVLAINPKIVIPMHQRESDTMEFKKIVMERSHTKVIILSPGEEYSLNNN
jgi:L-ascorbate metabolism protein UlaG (beta-lactamase superfamily)